MESWRGQGGSQGYPCPGMGEVTQMLVAIQRAESHPAEELLPLVYKELRQLAAQKLAREGPNQTLQATALVHEAWLRLGGDSQSKWHDRAAFFAAAAEAIRHILIDNARRKQAQRHGGGWVRVEFDDLDLAG